MICQDQEALWNHNIGNSCLPYIWCYTSGIESSDNYPRENNRDFLLTMEGIPCFSYIIAFSGNLWYVLRSYIVVYSAASGCLYMRFNPFLSLVITIANALRGHLHFPKNHIGEILTMEDGQKFTIFRQLIVDPGQDQPEKPGATFMVQFHVAHMSASQNKLFSLFPIPFFAGLPGFRSKLWMLNKASGAFQGIYEWDTAENAKNYANSFAMKFMTMRSARGSVSCEIIPKQPD